MNTGIPFKQSISCLILLWSHTYLCWSSFFSAQAQSGKRSEKNSSRAAVWPSTPNCSNSSLKIEMKSKQGVATLCDLSLASAWALLSHLFNLLPELSKSYLWFILSQPSEPWTERPSICRTGSRVTGIIKPEPSYGPCGASSPNLSIPVTSSPETLPFLALPSLRASNTCSMSLLHRLLPLPTKLRFLRGLLLIPSLPLPLYKLLRPFSLHFLSGKNEFLYSSNGIT